MMAAPFESHARGSDFSLLMINDVREASGGIGVELN